MMCVRNFRSLAPLPCCFNLFTGLVRVGLNFYNIIIISYYLLHVCMYYVFRDAHQDLAKIGDLDSSSDRIK